MKPPSSYKNLDDLAFEGRNKSYGAYELRKKYLKRGIISLLLACLIFLLLTIVPFLIYFLKETDTGFPDKDLYMVDYTFMPSPDDDMAEPARAALQPQPEHAEIPVIVDSVKDEPVQKPTENPPDETVENTTKNDSLQAGKGPSGQGSGTGDPNALYTLIDVYPRFPGGDEARLYFLRQNIRYPEQAVKSGVQGVVLLVFIIEVDGSVSHIEVKKGIGGGCDEEASRVAVSMPKWEPGKRSGRPVRVMVQMPIVFKIADTEDQKKLIPVGT